MEIMQVESDLEPLPVLRERIRKTGVLTTFWSEYLLPIPPWINGDDVTLKRNQGLNGSCLLENETWSAASSRTQ
jgi:hypothetical protein